MDTVRFQFELRDLAEVLPWGSGERGLTLHWFGLTDGWYDVIIGEHRLYSGRGDARGIAYPVVRLWEDLIEVVPWALKSVPEALATRLADVDAWASWVDRAWDLDDRAEVVSVALEWWSSRVMVAHHLVGAPTLQMWRFGDDLRIRWCTSSPTKEDPVWSSPKGDAIMSVSAFRDELIRFDRELIAAMHARVDAVEENWSRPEVKIDVVQLHREHADRATWLERALDVPRHREHPWEAVVDAVVELEREIGSCRRFDGQPR